MLLNEHRFHLLEKEHAKQRQLFIDTLLSVADVFIANGSPCWCLNDGYWNGTHTDTCIEANKVLEQLQKKDK